MAETNAAFEPTRRAAEISAWVPDQKFKTAVKDDYKAMTLHYWVPGNFKAKSLPLIIYLHGGGRDAASPRAQIGKVPETHGYYEAALGDFWEKTGAVVVAPQVYPNEGDDGWCDPRTEDYLASVILEAIARFNIDPDRVFLVGQSMGGFGAYHIMLNYPDRFAGIVACAGAWSTADFKNCIGTPVWILHGAQDAVYKKRPHFTDVQYARQAAEVFKRDGIPVNYRESEGGHRLRNHIKGLEEFWGKSNELKRSAAFKRIYISTPSGYSSNRMVPVFDRGWITINELKPGKITIDNVCAQGTGQKGGWNNWDFTEAEFNNWNIVLRAMDVEGGSIDAEYLGDNKFDIKTRNIKRFAVRMNNQMVDFAKPVIITVNGKMALNGIVGQKQGNLEECLRRRKDRGLLYDGKAEITLE